MSTRQEKFEAERNKMLSEMGKSEKIKLEPEEENIDSNEMIESEGLDFSNVSNQADREALEAAEQAAYTRFDNSRNNINPSKKQESFPQKIENKIFNDLTSTISGGFIMWILTATIVLPLAISCLNDTIGRPLATRIISPTIVFIAAWLMTRMLALVMGFIVTNND